MKTSDLSVGAEYAEELISVKRSKPKRRILGDPRRVRVVEAAVRRDTDSLGHRCQISGALVQPLNRQTGVPEGEPEIVSPDNIHYPWATWRQQADPASGS